MHCAGLQKPNFSPNYCFISSFCHLSYLQLNPAERSVYCETLESSFKGGFPRGSLLPSSTLCGCRVNPPTSPPLISMQRYQLWTMECLVTLGSEFYKWLKLTLNVKCKSLTAFTSILWHRCWKLHRMNWELYLTDYQPLQEPTASYRSRPFPAAQNFRHWPQRTFAMLDEYKFHSMSPLAGGTGEER